MKRIDNYDEKEMAEPTNYALPPYMQGLTNWHGYGKLEGKNARAVYYTNEEDEKLVASVGGDWGYVDWEVRLARIELLDDNGGVTETIYNERFKA